MLRIGLTGGLACGKSTVARRMAARGCRVIDADRVVHALYAPGQPGVDAVRALFGDDAIAADGAVDRRVVAGRVFGDADARRRLEEAIHPLVRARFRAAAGADALPRDDDRLVVDGAERIAVLEVAILFEAGFDREVATCVTVEVGDVEIQVARAVARGLAPDDARARIAAQLPSAERQRRADVTLWNDADLDALAQRTDALVTRLIG
ncbi:MAG: dephospho-CoA kinase [Acidobacteriota bacterium]